MVPAPFAARLSKLLDIPTIGIGAGVGCDGQVLVCNDLLGIDMSFQPKFLKRYSTLEERMVQAFSEYVREVREEIFPSPKQSFGVNSTQPRGKLEKLY